MIFNSKNLFYLIFSRLIIDFSYYFFVLDIYRYMGYIGDLNQFKINFIPSLLFLIPFLINQKNNYVSSFAISILLIGILLPVSSLFAFGMVSLQWFLINLFAFSFITITNNILTNVSFNFLKFKTLKPLNVFLCIFYILSTLTFLTQFDIEFDFSLFSLATNLIYDQRAKFFSDDISYLMYIFMGVGPPILLSFSIIYRKYFITFLSLLLLLIIFLATGQKSILFTYFLYLGIIFIDKIKKGIPDQLDYIKGYISLVFCGLGIYLLNTSSYLFASLLLNRLIYTPQLVSSFYYTYFNTHDYTYFLDTSFVSALYGKSYFTNLPREIGRIFVDIETSANTGIISDGYAKMGIVGIFVVCILFLISLRIIDSLSINKNFLFTKLIITYPIFSLINSSFFTSILTNGLLFSLAILMLIPENNKINEQSN